MRICHIADIHWRGLTRHDEYRRVFTAFFEKLRHIEPDVIYIGGDIFHTKTQNISPEVLECLDWWFTQLTDIAHVVVTLGNHDGNLMNGARQDAITPVVNMLRNPRITLYKQSGMYDVKIGDSDVTWCVFSCFDVDGWKNVRPSRDRINIATFHGSVLGSTTDSDYALHGEVDLKFFDGFDFVLLGDIHKMQHLGHRTCDDGVERPWISYCGSTIQQNYAETSEHGFLLWDIRGRNDFDVSFVPLDNPNRFITIDWQGDVASTLKLTVNDPPNARYRIRSQDTVHQADWRRLVKSLKSSKCAIEIVPKVEKVAAPVVNIDDVMISDVHDIADPNVMIRLIRGYVHDHQYDERTLKIVDEKIAQYIRSHIDVTIVRNVKWSIDKLTFANLFAYGDGNSIDFTALPGITGIFAANASGKSSIIGTLMYTLFNATDRGPVKNLNVINIRKDECTATAELTINGRKHEVTRSSIKHTNGSGYVHAITNLNFTALDTGELLNGEDRKVTDKRIRAMIGTADDFMLTSLAAQGEMKNFIKAGASQRKAILYRFLDLQVFEKLYEQAKTEGAAIKLALRDLPERDWDGIKRDMTTRRNSLNELIERCDSEISKLRETLTQLRWQLSGIADVQVTLDDVERQRSIVEQCKIKHIAAQSELLKMQVKFDVARDIVSKVDAVIATFPIEEYERREQQRNEVQAALNDIKMRLKNADVELASARSHVTKLDIVPCGDAFPTCRYIKDAHADKLRLPALHAVVDELTMHIDEHQRRLEQLTDPNLARKLQRFKRICKTRQRHVEMLDRANIVIELRERNVNDASIAKSAAELTLSDLEARFSTTSDVERKRHLMTMITETERLLSQVDVQRTKAIHDVGKTTAALEQVMREQAQYIRLMDEWRAYECIMSATSKRAIPSQLLRYFIPVINDEIARILNGIVGFTITLDVPEDSNAMEVYVDYGDSARLIELASGMEKTLASIAIRVALTNISSLPKTDMLIIDEGFPELDETNIDACCQLLRSLTRYYRSIIIITHLASLKDIVDNMIDIEREGIDSRVIVN